MQNQIDISKLSLTELQSLAYTLIEAVEVAQANLKMTNDEIAKRRKEASESKDELVEEANVIEEK